MILLSRLIKSYSTISKDKEERVIKLQPLFSIETDVDESPETINLKLIDEAKRLLQEAKERAEQIILGAQANLQETNDTITKLKNEWDQEKLNLTEIARDEGYQAGFLQGEKDANEQYSKILQVAKLTVEKSKLDFIEQVEQSEEVILRLGIKVAEKVLKAKIDENKEVFLQIVKHAIKEVKDYTDINVIVHPSMYELVLSQKDELRALLNSENNLFIYPNEELKESDCVIESSFGRIDASIDSQLAELKAKLLELLQEE